MAVLPDVKPIGASPQPTLSIARYSGTDESALTAPGLAQAQEGAVIGKAGDEIYAAMKVEQEKQDTLVAEDAYNKLQQKRLDLTYGQQGFTSLKGGDAANKPIIPEYGQKFQDATDEIANTLKDGDQAKLFKRRADVARLSFNEDLLKHVTTQNAVYAKDVYDGTVKVETQNVVANWDNPVAVDMSISRVTAATKLLAEKNGLPPEMQQAALQTDLGQIHSAVIQQAIKSGNNTYAEKWYDDHKAQIDLPTSKVLEVAVRDGQQKDLFNGYQSQYLGVQNDPKGLGELLNSITADTKLDQARQNVLIGRVQNQMQTLEVRQDRQMTRIQAVAEKGLSQLEANSLAGYDITPEQIKPYLDASKGNPILEARVNEVIQTANITRKFRLAGPLGQDQMITELTNQVRGGGKESVADLRAVADEKTAVGSAESGSEQWVKEHEERRVPVGDFSALDKEMGGEFGKGNISLNDRKLHVWSGNKGFSSLESVNFLEKSSQKEVLIPKVDANGHMMSTDEAIAEYHKTGKYLGKFDTPKEASDYAIALERRQNAYYSAGPGRHILDDAFKGAPSPDPAQGFLGPLKAKGGRIETDYGVPVTVNGKKMDVPVLVPTLTKDEVKTVLATPWGEPLPDSIKNKAIAFAKDRIAAGKPVFAQSGEQQDLQGAKTNRASLESITDAIFNVGERSGPNAVSPQGATGRAQIMPNTFKDYAKPGESYDVEADRVAVAKRKIADDYQFYGGDPVKVAAAYIGGRGAVRADGSIRDDVKDALGTTPAAYAQRVAAAAGGAKEARFDVQLLAKLQSIKDSQATQLKADPMTFAVRQGIIAPDTPGAASFDTSDPDKLDPAAFQARFGIARGMAKSYETAVKPLTQAEVQLASSTLRNATPDQKARYFGSLAKASGTDFDGYKAVVAQLAPDDPPLAIAGIYAGMGRSVTDFGMDPVPGQPTKVADLIIGGQAILHPPKTEDGKPPKGSLIPMPGENKMRPAFDDYVRTAYSGNAQANNAYYQTAQAIYAKLSADAGDKDTTILDTDRWKKSIQLATGGIDDYRGQRLPMPYGKDIDQFTEQLNRRINYFVTQGGMPPELSVDQLKNLPLKAVRDGVYVFRAGDGIQGDKNGKPIVIDFSKPIYDFRMEDIPGYRPPGSPTGPVGIATKQGVKPGIGVGPSAIAQ